jgi:hypothetical protein
VETEPVKPPPPQTARATGVVCDSRPDERGNLMLAAQTDDGRTIALTLNVN